MQQSLIARALRESGFDVSFLVSDLGQPDITSNAQGIELVKTFGLRNCGLLLKRVTILRLFRGMNMADADVYYYRAASVVTGLVALFCRFRRRKFIYAAALDWDVDGTWERLMNPLARVLYQYGVRHADVVLVQTNRQKELVEQRFRRAAVLIRNIYQMPEVRRQKRDCVLWVANFGASKRPWMFVDIAERMPEYEFVMAGRPMPGEEGTYEEIAAAARELPNLTVLGPVPYGEVGELYSRALVFANTSKVEGFPNSFLDALSRRVPVVATFDPDEIICTHNLGFHCNTVDEMVSGMRRILSSNELRRDLGENGYHYVKSMHEFSVVSRQYDDLLANLAMGTHGRADLTSRKR